MNLLLQDFEYIYSNNLPWKRMNNKTVLVTGASGLIGSIIVKFLDYLNKFKDYHIRILAIVRSEEKAKQLSEYDVKVILGDLCYQVIIEDEVDFIFHCAAITKTKDMQEKPIEVAQGIVKGTINVLDLAVSKDVESMVYLSSMEVYGKTDDAYITENDMGYIDPMQIRSCYPMGKRMAENLCASYWFEKQAPTKIARLAQVFGAGVSISENRVFAQFAKSARNGQDIILHTSGKSRGNYCYTADAVAGLFYLLLIGENGQAYNICNENSTMTIQEMAEMVANTIACGKITVTYEIPEGNSYGYPEATGIKLSSNKLRQLGWEPRYGMVEMYSRMMSAWDE
jgi:nucleoside-diphosphate-sugar epimerase